MFSKRNFADRTPNQKKYVITMKGNIWVDVFRLQKYVQRNCDTENVIQSTNTIWGLNTTIDGTDKGTLATEEDPGLTIDALSKSLDFAIELRTQSHAYRLHLKHNWRPALADNYS